jgi:anti-sigma regulatory factor (Ser/Thr protein kinase)
VEPVRRVLPARPDAVREARAAVTSLERGGLAAAVAADARLVVTELVSNSLRHGGLDPDDEIVLVLEAREATLRVEVADYGAGFAPRRVVEPPREATGGRGLLLVERLSVDWGIRREVGRTVVWADLPLQRRGAQQV